MSTITRPPLHRWNYADWERMVESGILEGQRVELIDGEIVEMSPQLTPHVAGLVLATAAVRRVFDESRVCIRIQCPLRLGRNSEPEPDVAIVRGTAEDYLSVHPQSAELVIEVAYSTLNFDRNDKASLYASAGLKDYWILNMSDGQCEVYRKPVKNLTERFGSGYAQAYIFKLGDSIAPLAAKGKKIAVADLLPKGLFPRP